MVSQGFFSVSGATVLIRAHKNITLEGPHLRDFILRGMEESWGVGGREGKEGREGVEETPFVYKQYSRRTHASSTRNEHSFFFL
jgi:hypothetical protein